MNRSKRAEVTAAVFEALAHPRRRHILMALHHQGGRMTAGEIAERFSCRWPTTTRHLRVLMDAELVRVRKRGRERVYHIRRGALVRNVGGLAGLVRQRGAVRSPTCYTERFSGQIARGGRKPDGHG